ncbi:MULTISPECIES: C40 family peptidase [unclassified Streptomyces]|uniref:C40 family peptidase n=1 Tax=unclassified Streptomyces TaxID=2593676 RepID=UPI0022720A1A|nr:MULTISPECIES: C40 family peptidase [unclassified Streptomyces]MCY0917855.1 NlpC/P60 family protein [Streptomyces sp. H27-G5]MCY0958138.1 NlpC/P60 family protein [Streptomyces sp. H27-H5]
MASHRRPKPPTRTRVSVLTALATAAVALSAQSAHAAPDKPKKDEVKEQVDALYEESEQAGEKANAAKDRQDKLEKEIGRLQDQVARGQADLNDLRNTLGSMATAQYRGGGLDQSMELLLAENPQDYLDKSSMLQQMSGKQVEAISQIQTKQRTLAQQRAEAGAKLADLDATRKELAEKKATAQRKLAEAQAHLNSLTAEERSQLKNAEAKAGEEAAKAAGGGAKPGAVKGSGRAAQALAAALTQEGKGYNLGSTGMAYWDCSSLAQWAYGQAGVQISRTTYTQVNDGTRIGMSQLQPGDLVFFYDDLHHVGLYAGNGQVFHASNPRGGVKYEAMRNMPFQFGVRVG